MSYNLHHMLYTLRDAKLVIKWEPLSNDCAKVWATPDRTFVVFVGSEYYFVDLTEVIAAHKKVPTIDYVVVSGWKRLLLLLKNIVVITK